MNQTTHRTLTLGDAGFPVVVAAVQNDTGRKLVLHLQDLRIPDGSGATIYAVKPSGAVVYDAAAIGTDDDGLSTVAVDLPANMLAETGPTWAQVQVISQSEIITTFPVLINVATSLAWQEISEGSNSIESDNSYPILLEQIRQISGFRTELANYARYLANVGSIFREPERNGQAGVLRIGNLMIVRGEWKLKGLNLTSHDDGTGIYGDAAFSTETKKTEADFDFSAAFPAAFSETPSIGLNLHGDSTTWLGHVQADTAGLTEARIFRNKTATNTSAKIDYIAVGRYDGARAGGARVISEGLPFVGARTVTDTDGTEVDVGAYFVHRFNEVYGGASQADDAAWCSEFASACAALAGVPEESFPRFASAYKGSHKFSEAGRFFLRQGQSFVRATIDGSTYNATASASGDEAWPEVGDVLFMARQHDDDADSGTYAHHTALVCSVDDGRTASTPYYRIYTVEGNLKVYDSSKANVLYTTVQRRVRDLYGTKAVDLNVWGLGKPDYAPDFGMANKIELEREETPGTEILSGTVNVTNVTANKRLQVPVSFDRVFSGTPRVTVTARSASASDTIQVMVSGVSSSGFTLNLTRSSAADTAVDWIAVRSQ